MINLILCGGSGTRLWPVSRSLMPKQFAPLFDGQSLFRKTVVTNSAVCESQFIVSNADQFFLAKDQLEMEGMTGSKFLLEPVGRNTAPAIALACLTMDPETIVLVSPSDHVIRKKDEYKKVLFRAQELAEEELVGVGDDKLRFADGGVGDRRLAEKGRSLKERRELLPHQRTPHGPVACARPTTKNQVDH